MCTTLSVLCECRLLLFVLCECNLLSLHVNKIVLRSAAVYVLLVHRLVLRNPHDNLCVGLMRVHYHLFLICDRSVVDHSLVINNADGQFHCYYYHLAVTSISSLTNLRCGSWFQVLLP
jgi:hypothetical protein